MGISTIEAESSTCDPTLQGRRIPPHRCYLACGGILAALYLLVPPVQGSPLLFDLLSGSSVVAVVVGIRRHRPCSAWPWYLFALGQLLFFLGDVYTYAYPRLIGRDLPFPSIGDGCYLAMYPLLMAGMLLVARQRSPLGDRVGAVDALIVTIGVGLVSWVFLAEPYVGDATLSPFAKLVSVAYPCGDMLLFAVALRLVFGCGRRQPAFSLLIMAVMTLFVTDATYGYALLEGSYHHQLIFDAGWLGYYLLWGAMALHPSMRMLGHPTPDRVRQLSRRKLALLTGASVLAPAIEIVRPASRDDSDLQVVLFASMLLFVLVVLRVAGLVRQFERSVERERVLQQAASALVAAARPEDIQVVALKAAEWLVGDAGRVSLSLVGPCGADGSGQRSTFAITSGESPGAEIAVSGEFPLSPLGAQSLSTLADSVSLALGSVDARARVHRTESEERFASLVRNASDLITVIDVSGVITYQSPSIERILGLRPDRVQGMAFRDLVARADREPVGRVLDDHERWTEGLSLECALVAADGRPVRFELLVANLLDDEHVRGLVLNGRDISERSALQARLTYQAYHDPVTSLPNRTLFTDRVQSALSNVRADRATAVIFLDLDDFTTVNDSLGHLAGDRVLREVAARLTTAMRPGETVARFGDDEFAVLLEDVTGHELPVARAQLIVETFTRPIEVDGREVFVRPSLGIALSDLPGGATLTDASELLRNADAAMTMCKRAGAGGHQIYETDMHASALARLELRADLQRAVEVGQFEVHFQPLVDLETGGVSGLEALCRWRHPERGLVSPDLFIPLAEESGLIVEIGRIVLHEACRRAVEFRGTSPLHASLQVGVNLSVKQLHQPEIVADVRRALERTGLPASMLVLEITETVMMADAALAAERLAELRDLGVRLAIDDFGTGYSSLGYLSQYPVNVLKMDRSFLESAGSVRTNGMAAAIISLGASLELEVVAEGIETFEQLVLLRKLGCDTGQGYLFAAPMTVDRTRVWLHTTAARGGVQVAPSLAVLPALADRRDDPGLDAAA